MTEDAIKVQLAAIQKSVDDGFDRVDNRLGRCEDDLKALREEGLPRRIGVIEKWKDRLATKLWGLLTGVLVALVAALVGAFRGVI